MIPDAIVRSAVLQLGEVVEIAPLGSGSHAGRSWMLTLAHGRAFAKRYGDAASAEQEARALRAVNGQLSVESPAVIASDANWLLLSACDGQPISGFRSAQIPQIGKTLASLHATAWPTVDDEWSAPRAFDARAASARSLALGNWEARIVHTLCAEVARIDESSAASPKVLCHRDCGPWNWLADAVSLTALIDFEHARSDWAVFDFLPLWEAGVLDAPEHRLSLADAYGDAPWQSALWAPAAALFVLQTLAWSARHPEDVRIRGRAEASLARWQNERQVARR